jgi:hypothetical protein
MSSRTSERKPADSLLIERPVPMLSAFLATPFLFGMAIMLVSKLGHWNSVPKDERFWTVFSSLVSLTVTASGWIYVATQRSVAGVIHGVIMSALGCFGLFNCLPIVFDPSGDYFEFGIFGALVGALVFICGVAVTYNSFKRMVAKSRGLIRAMP